MKKITLIFAVLLSLGCLQAQNISIENLLERLEANKNSPHSINEFFNQEERDALNNYFIENTQIGPVQRGGGLLAYGWESQGNGYGSFDVLAPEVFTMISPGSGSAGFEAAGAFNPMDLNQAYAMDNIGGLYELAIDTGVYTLLSSAMPVDITGMEYNPVDNVLYATTLTELYIIDTDALTATLVGPLNTAGLVAIALAIDGAGNAYTYDIVDDSFYTVDLTTGNATLVGLIGFDAGFGQGMAWDGANDQILMTAFNVAGNLSELRSVDVTTGATTLLGEILPGPLTQVAWVTIPVQSVLNDDPETAASLTVGEVFEDFPVIADNTEATTTAIDDPSCGNFTEADLWYSVVVPDSGSVSVESQEDDGSITDTAISIYEGEIGSLVEVVCNDDGGIGLFSLAEVEDRTPGEVLFVRVWEWNGGSLGTFQMSAYDTPPPANDDPEGAIPLTVGAVFTDFPVTGSNVSATDTAIDDPSCGNYGGADVWFSVVVPSTGQVNVETDTAGGITDTGMSLYTGEIGSLVELVCDDDGGNGLFSLTAVDDPALAGMTLFVRVWEWGGGGFGPFQVSAYSDCPVNAAAIEVTETGDTEVSICTGDELPDPINVTIVGEGVGTNSGWVITDNATNEILGLPAAPPFDLEGVEPGVCGIWYIRYEDGLTGLEVGSNVADLDGCFDLSNPILVDRVDEGGVCEMCEYTLEMNDTFGDGWNGAMMDVLVDGVVVLNDVALDDDPNNDGFQGILTFPVNSTADVTTAFGDGGGFPIEISYRILDANGVEVGAGTADPTTDILPGTITADCPSCVAPSGLIAENITGTSADLSWTDGNDPAAMSYDLEWGESGFTLGTGTVEAGLTDPMFMLTGLDTETAYDFYVTANCTDDDSSVVSQVSTFTTLFVPDETCGGNYIDSGGLTNGYSADESITTTIMPDNDGDVVTVTFTYVDIETAGGGGTQDGCWDFLTVYDGPDTSSPVLAATLCGEESGDGGVPSVPESNLPIGTSFTSTHPSGALTFVFTSDGTVQETGWEADITCGEPPLSVDDNTFEGFAFFPNPVGEVLNLDARSVIENVTVYNLLGQKVLEQEIGITNYQLNTSNLARGAYIMQVTIDGQTNPFKIVKR